MKKKPYTTDKREPSGNNNAQSTGYQKSYNNNTDGKTNSTLSYNKNKFNKTENSNYYNKGNEGQGQSHGQESYQQQDNSEQYSYKNSYNGNADQSVSGYKKTYRPKKQFYKVGDNKFDQCNTHLPQFMGMMQPQYSPNKVPTQQSYMPVPRYQDSTPNLADDSDKAIVEYLEQYLSLENLNKDLYLRNRIDTNGYIEGNEIVNHNKVSRKGITLERLTEVVKEHNDNPVIEAAMTQDEKLILRNRDWDNLQSNLVSKESIFQQRKIRQQNVPQQYQYPSYPQHPSNTMNYVTLQNNYFFANGMPQQGMHHGIGMPMGNHMYQQQGFGGYPMVYTNQDVQGHVGSVSEQTQDVQK